MLNKNKIVIICGGFSDEREISLRSGKNVYETLNKLDFKQVDFFDIDSLDAITRLINQHQQEKYDFAYLMTHGSYGEDGCIQGLLELIDLPYSGSGVLTSALCMDKEKTKEVLLAHKLPILQNLSQEESKAKLNQKQSLIAKPKVGGSSLGIVKLDTIEQFNNFWQEHSYTDFLIEEFIQGVEVTTSIIEAPTELVSQNHDYCAFDTTASLISLPILELRSENEFYDYQAKYTQGMTEFVLPAELDQQTTQNIHQAALNAYKVLNCKGLARVDFIISPNNHPYILEVNTLPGMTNLSDSPAQALAAGISFESLLMTLARPNNFMIKPKSGPLVL